MFSNLTPILLSIIGVLALGVIILALRQRVLFRIGTRNIYRRRINTILIVLGAMLGTSIITTAFVTGDTLDFSIKRAVYEQMGEIDITLAVEQTDAGQSLASLNKRYFPQATAETLVSQLVALDGVEAALPLLMLEVPLEHIDPQTGETILFESSGRLIGADISALCALEKMTVAECPALSANEAIVTPDLAQSLDLAPGDIVVANYRGEQYEFTVKSIMERPGLWQMAMGPFPSYNVFVPLPSAQTIVETAPASLAIPPQIEQFLAQTPYAAELATLVQNPPERYEDLPEQLRTDLAGNGMEAMVRALFAGQEVGIAPAPVTDIILSNVGGVRTGFQKSAEIIPLIDQLLLRDEFADGPKLVATPAKQDEIEAAELSSETITQMFLILGAFSAFAGTLLIINIFVMLAQERKSEMGIMRAIGLKRRDLVKSFVLEGGIYAAIASLLGTLVGLLLAYLAIRILEYLFNSISFFEGSFNLVFNFSLASLLNSFAIGYLITLLSIVATSWKISNINIVHAVRDIVAVPIKKFSLRGFIIASLLLLLGAGIALAGFAPVPDVAPLALLGPCLIAIALAMLLKFKLPDRLVFTTASLFILLYATLGYQVIDNYFNEIAVFVMVGLLAVFSSVILIIFNDRIILWPLDNTLGRLPSLRATIKIIVTYPLSSRFRTGMTLVMYSLIIFVVVLISVMKTVQQQAIDQTIQKELGDFELQLQYNPQNPIYDLSAAIAASDELDPADFETVTRLAFVLITLDESKYDDIKLPADPERSIPLMITGVDEAYIDHKSTELAAYAPQFSSAEEVWQALLDHPEYIIIDSMFDGRDRGEFKYPDLQMGDTLFVCSLQAPDSCLERTVIGRTAGVAFGLYSAVDGLARDFGITADQMQIVYQIGLAAGVDTTTMVTTLEKAFVAHGVQVVDLESQVREILSLMQTFFTLMQGFLGMGLVAGIAGLSIIVVRSVHERRQQIGVLRAIGFRRSAVLTSFLGETTFISLLGIMIGTVLGVVVSYFLYLEEIRDIAPEAQFVVPWLELTIIIGLAYIFSLIGTLWPSRKAANLTPAEVLRYQG